MRQNWTKGRIFAAPFPCSIVNYKLTLSGFIPKTGNGCLLPYSMKRNQDYNDRRDGEGRSGGRRDDARPRQDGPRDSNRPFRRDDDSAGSRPRNAAPRSVDRSGPRSFNRDDKPRTNPSRESNRSFDRDERPRDPNRSSGRDDRRPFDGERRPFNRNNDQFESRPRRSFDQEERRDTNRPFNRDDRRPDDRRPFNREERRDTNRPFDRDRKPFERGTDRPASRSFDRDNGGERRSFDRDRKPFDRPERRDAPRSFDRDRNEDRPRRSFDRDERRDTNRPFNRDERPSYGESRPADRDNRFGERRDDRPRDANRSFNRDERRPFQRDDRSGERKPFERNDRSGERRDNNRNDGEPNEPRFDRRAGRFEKAPNYNMDAMKQNLPRSRRVARNLDRERQSDPDSIRLNRYIANAGICSRREADELIGKGDVQVNGKVVTEMGYRVKPGDVVKYGNKVLNPEKMVYVLLNKPKDVITTTDDPEERNTVMDLVADAGPFRLYPVGRLDRNTTGLLLMTNDGELASKLTHPSNNVKKVYQVEIDKPITDEHFEAIRNGLDLEDGHIKPDDLAIVTPDAQVVGVEIHSGRNRIVRRMFESLGYEVTKLDRTVFAGLTKKELPRGKWRFLEPKEVVKLKYLM